MQRDDNLIFWFLKMNYETDFIYAYVNQGKIIVTIKSLSFNISAADLAIKLKGDMIYFCARHLQTREMFPVVRDNLLFRLLDETSRLEDKDIIHDNLNMISSILSDAIEYAYSQKYTMAVPNQYTRTKIRRDYEGVEISQRKVYIFGRQVEADHDVSKGYSRKKHDRVMIQFLLNIVDAPRNIPAKR